jgi:hypothetical protein
MIRSYQLSATSFQREQNHYRDNAWVLAWKLAAGGWQLLGFFI